MTNVTDIRTQRSAKEESKLKQPSTPLEKRMQEFAREVDERLKQIEERQRRIDSVLARLLKKISKLPVTR
jgi:hypothetical protein